MKKIFTLFFALFALTTVWAAETDNAFQFTDLEGNPVADGSVITVNTLNEEGQMVVPLMVKNVSGEAAAATLFETIDAMPNGTWRTCAFGNCMTLTETGYSPKNIVDADYNASIQTEWIPEAGKYSTWEATLEVHVFNIETNIQFGEFIDVVGSELIGKGPKVTVRFEYKDPNAQQEQQVWWGYVSPNDECGSFGTAKTETYNCTAFFPGNNQVVAGKTIKAVRIKLLSENVKNVKVWISKNRPSNVNTGTIETVNVAEPVVGINDVPLTTPYTIDEKGIYVGYTFTQSEVQTDEDKHPVATAGTDKKDAFWIKTSSTLKAWKDVAGNGYGRLFLQMLLEGDIPYENGAYFEESNLGEFNSSLNAKVTLSLPVTNLGTAEMKSFDFTVTSDGVTGPEQHVDLETALAYGFTTTVPVEVDGDDAVGQRTKTITITKVNGVANEYAGATATYTVTTYLKVVTRGIAVEEFTGTQCGYCPRGMAGMDKLRQKYGDRFVGTAVHGYASGTETDAMYLTNWSNTYAGIFSGSAPACQLNRAYGEIDPYNGTGQDICIDFERELSKPAKVGIELSGEWNADSTMVTATAVLEALAVESGGYDIEFMLIADSLKGTGTAWKQSNYYSTNNTTGDPYLDQFCKGGQYGQSSISGWTFNDAVIATCYANSKNKTTAPGVLTVGEPVTNTYTLSMPADDKHAALRKAIKKKDVAVVCLVIAPDKTVANAAKFYMPVYKDPDTQGITLVQQDNTAEQRYSLEGHRLQGAKKGLNIIRKADGTTRKVFVR